jgi:hypothetical protein
MAMSLILLSGEAGIAGQHTVASAFPSTSFAIDCLMA